MAFQFFFPYFYWIRGNEPSFHSLSHGAKALAVFWGQHADGDGEALRLREGGDRVALPFEAEASAR